MSKSQIIFFNVVNTVNTEARATNNFYLLKAVPDFYIHKAKKKNGSENPQFYKGNKTHTAKGARRFMIRYATTTNRLLPNLHITDKDIVLKIVLFLRNPMELINTYILRK